MCAAAVSEKKQSRIIFLSLFGYDLIFALCNTFLDLIVVRSIDVNFRGIKTVGSHNIIGLVPMSTDTGCEKILKISVISFILNKSFMVPLGIELFFRIVMSCVCFPKTGKSI